MQQARAMQRSEAFAGYRKWRLVVEHRLARLVQLGIRQARYFGRAKTRFQLYLAATVANLTLVAGKAGKSETIAAVPRDSSVPIAGIANPFILSGAGWLGQLKILILLASASLPKALFATRGFRPSF